ncbi:hypothetical protein CLF_107750 [Clonorchis sinensis]|uniref:Uncharacterized protein n=1 Tax=Clonorchis sinensis TaxID=79923 RepID=G7YH57_CLOSI|nr:hypothetical protein CLF_107750 [Clonorchis sinensis]
MRPYVFMFQAWPLRPEGVRMLLVSDHCCHRSLGRIWWEYRINNAERRPRANVCFIVRQKSKFSHFIRIVTHPFSAKNSTFPVVFSRRSFRQFTVRNSGVSVTKRPYRGQVISSTRSQPQLNGTHIWSQVNLNFRACREALWTRNAAKLEYAKNAGKIRRSFHLNRSTGPRKPLVSEITRHQNGPLISRGAECLDRRVLYFEQQISWPPATFNSESWPSTERLICEFGTTLNLFLCESPFEAIQSQSKSTQGEHCFKHAQQVRKAASASPSDATNFAKTRKTHSITFHTVLFRVNLSVDYASFRGRRSDSNPYTSVSSPVTTRSKHFLSTGSHRSKLQFLGQNIINVSTTCAPNPSPSWLQTVPRRYLFSCEPQHTNGGNLRICLFVCSPSLAIGLRKFHNQSREIFGAPRQTVNPDRTISLRLVIKSLKTNCQARCSADELPIFRNTRLSSARVTRVYCQVRPKNDQSRPFANLKTYVPVHHVYAIPWHSAISFHLKMGITTFECVAFPHNMPASPGFSLSWCYRNVCVGCNISYYGILPLQSHQPSGVQSGDENVGADQSSRPQLEPSFLTVNGPASFPFYLSNTSTSIPTKHNSCPSNGLYRRLGTSTNRNPSKNRRIRTSSSFALNPCPETFLLILCHKIMIFNLSLNGSEKLDSHVLLGKHAEIPTSVQVIVVTPLHCENFSIESVRFRGEIVYQPQKTKSVVMIWLREWRPAVFDHRRLISFHSCRASTRHGIHPRKSDNQAIFDWKDLKLASTCSHRFVASDPSKSTTSEKRLKLVIGYDPAKQPVDNVAFSRYLHVKYRYADILSMSSPLYGIRHKAQRLCREKSQPLIFIVKTVRVFA